MKAAALAQVPAAPVADPAADRVAAPGVVMAAVEAAVVEVAAAAKRSITNATAGGKAIPFRPLFLCRFIVKNQPVSRDLRQRFVLPQ